MIIKLMHDEFDATARSMLFNRVSQFIEDLVVFTDKGETRMMDRLILKFNNRPKHGSDGILSDLQVQLDLLKGKALPNTCDDGRFEFKLIYPEPENERNPMQLEFTVKLVA